jgi:hypothetical protein
MKKAGFSIPGIFLFSIIILTLATAPAKAQFFYWLPQKALTDSFADNINPCVASYYGSDYQDHTLLFWERSTDSSSTALYYRNLGLGEPTEPVELLSTPGVHYTNPKVLIFPYYFPGNDTSLLLFFESDASGSKDIYFMKYYQNSSFTPPQLFSALPGNDLGLSIAGNDNKYLAWENEGRILQSDLLSGTDQFSSPVVLANTGASSPAASDYQLSWLQQVNDSSKVLYMNRQYQSGGYVFDGPYTKYDKGSNSKLNSSKGFIQFGFSGLMIWQNKSGEAPWQIRLADINYMGETVREFGSPAYNYHSPDVFDFPIITKSPTFMTFVTDSLGNDEVMTSSPYWDGFYDEINQSDYAGPDRNPHFFGITNDYIYEIQLLWESLRNGHWTIFQTHYDMIFGLEDKPSPGPVNIYPNPITQLATIRLNSPSNNQTLTIYNSMNVPVRHLQVIPDPGKQDVEVLWDARDDRGRIVPPGLYIFSIPGNKGMITGKLMKK